MFRFAQPIRFSHCDPAGRAQLDRDAHVGHKTAMISRETMRAVPIPPDLRRAMQRFAAA